MLQTDASQTLTAVNESSSFVYFFIVFGSINICGSSSYSCSNGCVTSLWHKRLGHALISVLRRVADLHNIKIQDHQCSVCPISKQTRLLFPKITFISSCSLDIIHAHV